MTYNEFLEEINGRVEARYTDLAKVQINKVRKNNGVVLDGLVILKNGENVSPTIYLNDFYKKYQDGIGLGEITKEIIDLYENNICSELDFSYFADFENIRKRIVYKVINKAENKELLENIPHEEFLDLAICYGIYVRTNRFGNGMMLIQNQHLDMWNVNQKSIEKEARRNTPVLLKPQLYTMGGLLNEMFFEAEAVDEDERQSDLFVLTNCEKFLGAGCILYEGMMEDISKRLGGDLYILPSSINEVIILRKSEGFSKQELLNIVKSVNDDMDCRQEILSYMVYEYDAKSGIIHL